MILSFFWDQAIVTIDFDFDSSRTDFYQVTHFGLEKPKVFQKEGFANSIKEVNLKN